MPCRNQPGSYRLSGRRNIGRKRERRGLKPPSAPGRYKLRSSSSPGSGSSSHVKPMKRLSNRETGIRVLLCLEAGLLVRAVAEGLLAGLAAAAKPGLGFTRNRPSARRADLQRSLDHQRTVFLRRDLQRPVAGRQGFARFAFGFPGRGKSGLNMAVVAIGLALRLAAAAERGTKA